VDSTENARLAAIVKSTADAIISLTPDGVIETWNESAARLFGYGGHEAVGQPAPAFLARDPAELERVLARVVASGQSVRTESENVRKDGSVVQVAATDSPIRVRRGRVTGVARIARDITDRSRL
jgi:PAS domain S-box-containing protein